MGSPLLTDMKSSLVSIIIPVYNGSNYLREAIDSAIAQTYKNIEVIVVNDGSTDNGKTDKIAKSYGNKISYYRKKNGGVATALNFGIRKMKGEWFSWLSHDDIYEPFKIKKLVKYISDHPKAKILYTDYELVNERGMHLYNISVKPKNFNNMQLRLIDSYPLNGCAMLIKKDCFAKVGNFDESLQTTQDYDLWYRLAKYYKYHYISISTLKSRQHVNQGSHLNNHKVEVDNLYDRFISNLSTSIAAKEKGNQLGSWFLEVARLYKKRGYSKSPLTTLNRYRLFTTKRGFTYWLTVFYCSLPTNLVTLIADLEHKFMRMLYRMSGCIKNNLKKII